MKQVLLALIALVWASPAFATAATPGRVAFDIYMNGAPVGRHQVDVTTTGAETEARVSIDMKGRVGPFSFTYQHRCVERWRGATLLSLDCVDAEGRKSQTVKAARREGVLTIAGARFNGPAPDDAQPTSWWRGLSPAQTRMIDTRAGAIMRVRVRSMGVETLNLGGAPIQATRMRLRGAVDVDQWYDANGRWVKAAFRLRGQSFEYRLRSPLQDAPRA